MIWLLWLNDMSSLVQGDVSLGLRIRLLWFKNTTSLVQEDTFVKVMTSVSSSAEPSQQVCSL